MDSWLKDNLVCPRDYRRLKLKGKYIVCPEGHKYPIVDGIPVMLLKEVPPTHETNVEATFRKLDSYLSLGEEKFVYGDSFFYCDNKEGKVHPFVQKVVADTCGQLYKPLVNKLVRYPIPDLPLPQGCGKRFLEIGSSWGRWCIAAAKNGYNPVGIDPSLDAIMAAREVSRQLNISAIYLVADGRYLPFPPESFDIVFSYSVLQHFSKYDVKITLNCIKRVLKKGGKSLIQMPNKFGIRSLYNQIKRKFREPIKFEVRYWRLHEMLELFSEVIGPSNLFVDAFFGLGIQKSDIDLLPWRYKLVVCASEALRRLSNTMDWLIYFADSVYVESTHR